MAENTVEATADRRASLARAAIDDQKGFREHAHRLLRAGDLESMSRVELGELKDRVRLLHQDCQQELAEVRKSMMRRMPTEEYHQLRSRRAQLGVECQNLAGLLGQIRDRINTSMPDREKYPFRFIEAARVMLPPEVFDAISAAAARTAWHEHLKRESEATRG